MYFLIFCLIILGVFTFFIWKQKKRVIEKIKKYIPLKTLVFTPMRVEFLWKREISKINQDLALQIKKRLKDPSNFLHIVFYVCEKSKWNCQSIYEIFKKNPRVKITFALGPNDVVESNFANKEKAQEINKHNHDFYKSIDSNVIRVFDDESGQEFQKLEDLKADVIFYQQPWGEMGDYPSKQIGRSLAVYLPYSFLLIDWDDAHYNRVNFHYYLWKYYTQTEIHKNLHLSYDPLAFDKIIVAGYPKLDAYFDSHQIDESKYWKILDRNIKRIVYAPHHSIGNSNLRLSTFANTYQYFLSLAKTNTKLQWIYKPHPTMGKSVVEHGLMSEKEYQDYANEWDNLPNAKRYEGGNYFDLFKSSDVLITDCASFLAEYLPTKKPIIHLLRKDSVSQNEVGKKITKDFYQVHNTEDIESLIEKVVVNGDDFLGGSRMEALSLVIPNEKSAGETVVNDILGELFEN